MVFFLNVVTCHYFHRTEEDRDSELNIRHNQKEEDLTHNQIQK